MLLQVFINTELYARVSVAALFHQLWKQIKEKSKLETEEALQCGKLFLLKLLDSAVPFYAAMVKVIGCLCTYFQ
jgi:tRNA guanosine-2'-O-methyltransferase